MVETARSINPAGHEPGDRASEMVLEATGGYERAVVLLSVAQTLREIGRFPWFENQGCQFTNRGTTGSRAANALASRRLYAGGPDGGDKLCRSPERWPRGTQ